MFFLPNFLQKGELKELHSDIAQEAIVFAMQNSQTTRSFSDELVNVVFFVALFLNLSSLFCSDRASYVGDIPPRLSSRSIQSYDSMPAWLLERIKDKADLWTSMGFSRLVNLL